MNIENELANAFYDEDYLFIEHATGKKPNNQEEAEKIINEWLSPRNTKLIKQEDKNK